MGPECGHGAMDPGTDRHDDGAGVASARPPLRGFAPSLLLAVWLCCTAVAAAAQDTPEMLAAMRTMLPPLPEHVPAWEELPAELRRQVPAFRIEVHRWHADPAERFVQVAGRRVDEGGVVGQELWLRAVRADAVVMQFRNHVFVWPL
jgi:hypothetical protein